MQKIPNKPKGKATQRALKVKIITRPLSPSEEVRKMPGTLDELITDFCDYKRNQGQKNRELQAKIDTINLNYDHTNKRVNKLFTRTEEE